MYLPYCCIKVEAKALKKTLHDNFVQLCIHLTANSQSVYSCFGLVDITDALKVSQSKAFFISFASHRPFSMQL